MPSGRFAKLIEKRSQLTDDDVTAFLEAGFEKEHLLGVIAVVAQLSHKLLLLFDVPDRDDITENTDENIAIITMSLIAFEVSHL
jgi:hypothetical protein